MDWQGIIVDSLFRWIHVVAGILWIGTLYFFNFVNGPFVAKLDGETKRKVVPELMPRALFWFRWGAAFTWVTGVVLLTVIFYHGRQLTADQEATFAALNIVGIVLVFVAPFLYDILVKVALKAPPAAFFGGLALASGYVLFLMYAAGFEFRAYSIHLGAAFGTIMAFNVWFRIWPAQRKIITAVKEGQPPDAALVSMAGARSKHNTYMSVPLVLAMISTHSTWMSSFPWIWPVMILVSWAIVFHLYKVAGRVSGF
jgi:uncharacterized membrane protein